MIWGRADVIIIEIKCTINVMCLNNPETIPKSPGPWKNCLPRNQSLMPKRLGTNVPNNFSPLITSISNLSGTLRYFTCHFIWISNSQLHQIQCYWFWDPCSLSPLSAPQVPEHCYRENQAGQYKFLLSSFNLTLAAAQQPFYLSHTFPGTVPTEAVPDLPLLMFQLLLFHSFRLIHTLSSDAW